MQRKLVVEGALRQLSAWFATEHDTPRVYVCVSFK